METTQLLQDLAKLREQATQPMTHMQAIRFALQNQIGQLSATPMPQILTEEQRKVLLEDMSCVEEFLKSEDGSDAVELLMIAFKEFKKSKDDAVEKIEQMPPSEQTPGEYVQP